MRPELELFLAIVFTILLGVGSTMFAIECDKKLQRHYYRQGQIDAVNGVMKYELREMPDGSKQWMEIEQIKTGAQHVD